MQNQASTNARKFATALRREMTDGERLLWQRLRGEQLGFKFRRQHPLGPYVADFACLVPRLIIEVDGSQHQDHAAYDGRRDLFFRNHRFDVMRFPANLPFTSLQSMVEAIYNRVTELAALAPIPAFPQRGKEPENSPKADPQVASSVLLLPPLGEGRDGGLPASSPEFTTQLPRKNSP
jgi:very-short-patch-repair endonuclease